MFLVKVPEGSSPVSVILRTLTVLSFSFSDNEFWISSEMMYIFFAEKKIQPVRCYNGVSLRSNCTTLEARSKA